METNPASCTSIGYEEARCRKDKSTKHRRAKKINREGGTQMELHVRAAQKNTETTRTDTQGRGVAKTGPVRKTSLDPAIKKFTR